MRNSRLVISPRRDDETGSLLGDGLPLPQGEDYG